jgi:hypothetical protein
MAIMRVVASLALAQELGTLIFMDIVHLQA